ncbi:alpha/beta hydrolase [Streptomyces sp. NPDC057302]|uniref:alpha/beta hydrolase n=1 Tax=Streptomyces sp. NPDC057302 TaxID=3346094 RepID=UPI00363CB6D9
MDPIELTDTVEDFGRPAVPGTAIRTVRYATGSGSKLLDIHTSGRPDDRCVLLWHGMGPDERDVMATLAREIAALGPTVLVPDWRSDRPDGGREHLTDALRFGRDHVRASDGGPGRLILAGWSAGASAAVGVALQPELFDGWRPAAVVALAGGYRRPAATTGTVPLQAVGRAVAPVPVRLVHGTTDTVVPVESSRELHEALLAHGWDCELSEPVTDHAGVLGCVYGPTAGRCLPAAEPSVVALGRETARVIAGAAAPFTPA